MVDAAGLDRGIDVLWHLIAPYLTGRARAELTAKGELPEL